jgi:hypothetical protein
VEVGATVLVDEIVGFAICREVDGVSLLLEIMPEMKAAGRVPKPLPAYHKEELHGTTALCAGKEWSGIMVMLFRVLCYDIVGAPKFSVLRFLHAA